MQQSMTINPMQRGTVMRHDTFETRQPISTLASVYTTPTMGSLAEPAGALYAPFASQGMAIQAAGFNAARLLANKSPYPVIVGNAQQRDELNTTRQDLIDQCIESIDDFKTFIKEAMSKERQSVVDFHHLRSKIGEETFDAMVNTTLQQRRLREALLHLDIVSNQNQLELSQLRPGVDKLYLLGQGAPGVSTLGAGAPDSREVTATELARQLEAGGLDTMFNDFRVLASHSADARLPESFKPEDLERAVLTGPETAFAQALSDALAEAGFEWPVVSGYSGADAIDTQPHHLRRLSGTQEKVRASSVRQSFYPTR